MKKTIEVFAWATMLVTILGALLLLNEGSFNVYTFWDVLASIAFVYYIDKWGNK